MSASTFFTTIYQPNNGSVRCGTDLIVRGFGIETMPGVRGLWRKHDQNLVPTIYIPYRLACRWPSPSYPC